RRRGVRRSRVQGFEQPGRSRVGDRDHEPAGGQDRMSSLGGKAAIAGIGQTEFSKESGRSELQLACEAIKAALDDAGLAPREVDGLATFTMDSSEEAEVGRNLGIERLSMFSRVPYGGGAGGGVVMEGGGAPVAAVADRGRPP